VRLAARSLSALRVAQDVKRPAGIALSMADVIIRKLAESDAAAAASVFYDAVHFGAGGQCDGAQRKAWAPAPPERGSWRETLA